MHKKITHWGFRLPCFIFTPRPRHILRAREDRAYAGRLGEAIAARHVRQQSGYSLLLRNWRHGKGEIDLIARKDNILIFIEVRTRRSEALVSGYHSLTHKKRSLLKQTARAYVQQLSKPPQTVRHDVIEITLTAQGEYRLNHFTQVEL